MKTETTTKTTKKQNKYTRQHSESSYLNEGLLASPSEYLYSASAKNNSWIWIMIQIPPLLFPAQKI